MNVESNELLRGYRVENKPKEECGVFGIFFPHPEHIKDIGQITIKGMFPNQHRGEESSGIVVADGQEIFHPFKKMGLIKKLYEEFSDLPYKPKGFIGIGHNRYSTTGSSNIKNAAPFISQELGGFAVSHNGNITNVELLKRSLIEKSIEFKSTTDSEIICALISNENGKSWEEKIVNGLSKLDGAFSLVMCSKDTLYAARDPWGIRPLYIAKIIRDGVEGYAISSETPSFYVLSVNGFCIESSREVLPGELIIINNSGIKNTNFSPPKKESFCGLEIAYLMRPDSRLGNIQLDSIRRHLGKKLAENYYLPKDIDFVTYIPESSRSGAEGFAEAVSLPVKTTMIKGRYGTIDGAIRGFISPNDAIRREVAKGNYFPLDILKDKKIVLMDDSVIRGRTTGGVINTIKYGVGLLRKSGAKEVHVRIIFPPVIGGCPLGVDIGKNEWLVAKEYKNTKDIAQFLNVDSIEYLSDKEYQEGVNEILKARRGLCLGCANGIYPIDSLNINKHIFEEKL